MTTPSKQIQIQNTKNHWWIQDGNCVHKNHSTEDVPRIWRENFWQATLQKFQHKNLAVKAYITLANVLFTYLIVIIGP